MIIKKYCLVHGAGNKKAGYILFNLKKVKGTNTVREKLKAVETFFFFSRSAADFRLYKQVNLSASY